MDRKESREGSPDEKKENGEEGGEVVKLGELEVTGGWIAFDG